MKKVNEFRRLEIVSIIFVSLIVLFFAWTIFSEKSGACAEDAKVCNDGTIVVREGKNCEFAPCPDTEENKNYCTPEQRQVDACIEIYQPVCGYPNKETFSNSCFACMDESVEYWVDGICE